MKIKIKNNSLIRDLPIIHIYQTKIKLILISILLINFISCSNKKENYTNHNINTYNWNAAISSPKFYPVGGVRVDFGYASAGVLTSFDSGWGDTSGSFISGEEYKPIPENVYIRYACGANNFVYEGSLKLPKKKIESIFIEQSKPPKRIETKKALPVFQNKKKNLSSTPRASTSFDLIVGMAPGGWIRIWIDGNGDFEQIEILKAQLKGYEDETSDEKFKARNLKNWGEYFTYWQYHGIPYEAWAENEKEYPIRYTYTSQNDHLEALSYQSISKDGTFYPGDYLINSNSLEEKKVKEKLPVQTTFSWYDPIKNISYDTFVVFPKNFEKIYTTPYIDNLSQTQQNYSQILLDIDTKGDYAKVYVIGKNKKTLLLGFKANISKSTIIGSGDYSKELQYFIH